MSGNPAGLTRISVSNHPILLKWKNGSMPLNIIWTINHNDAHSSEC